MACIIYSLTGGTGAFGGLGGIGGAGGGGGGNFPYLFSKYSGLAFHTLILIF